MIPPRRCSAATRRNVCRFWAFPPGTRSHSLQFLLALPPKYD